LRHVLEIDTPAQRFADCYLLGSGALGAALYGQPRTERVDLNVDTLWSGGPARAASRPAPRTVASLRAAVASGDHRRADELAVSMQSGAWVQAYQPLGWLEWGYDAREDADGLPAGYRRRLDLATGIATTDDGAGATLDGYVSAADGVLVLESTGARTAAPVLRSGHPVRTASSVHRGVTWLTMSGRAPSNVLPHYVPGDEPVVYADDAPDRDGLVDAGMGFAVVAAWVTGPTGARVLVSAESGFRGWDERPSADVDALAAVARARVEAALGLDDRALRERHVRDHQELFARCDLDLSASAERHPEAARAELYFDLGRYLLVAGSRPGSQPLTLQGIWNADLRPAWSSNLTTNINAPMSYWGAETTGLGDLHAPLLDLVDDLLVAGRETARRLYGARGACAHHNTDLWRFTDPVTGLPQWVSWSAALWWLADHVVQHHAFLAPGPEADTVLRARVLPVLRSCAAFALDMLVEHTDGELVVSPSSSPEHAFVVDGAPFAVTWGSAMDQELVHDVLTRTVELLGRHGDDAEDGALVAEARDALERLRLPAVIDGRTTEWADDLEPEEPGHRHLSHLYGLFPGSRLTTQGSADERAAARAALDLRLSAGSGYTGWSQAWVLCLAARLRDPELAERSVATLVGPLSSRSLLDLHPLEGWPGGAVFQIDGNLGAVAGIAELLLQSHGDAIVVLPALPRTWPSGTVRGLRARGGHVVDVVWDDGALSHAVVHAGASGEVVVDLPTPDGGRGRRAVPLRRGESVTVTPAGAVTGSPPGAGAGGDVRTVVGGAVPPEVYRYSLAPRR